MSSPADRPPELIGALELRAPGLWAAPRAQPVSYPEGWLGVLECLQGESFWFAHRQRCILALVEVFPPAGRLWEIGGGNGATAVALAAAGLDVGMVEPLDDGATRAHHRGVALVVNATLEEARFADRSVAAFAMFDVLEHVADDTAFLCQLRRALQPGGRLYLTVPAGPWLWSDNDVHAGHHRRYTNRSLRRSLVAAGFAVELASRLFWPLPPAIFLRRSLASRLGRRRRYDDRAAAREHGQGSAFSRRLAAAFLAVEVACVRRRLPIPFGSTLLAAASAAD